MGVWTDTIPTLGSLHVPTAAELAKITALLTAMTGAETAYTPVWTGSTTNPVINNGSITGHYRRLGKRVEVEIRVLMGGTTTFGTGNWALTLPVAALKETTLAGLALDNAPAGRPVACQIAAGTVNIFRMHTANGIITNLVPWTWAQFDSLTIRGSYETA